MTSRQIYYAVTGKRLPRRSPRKRFGKRTPRDWKYKAWIRTLPCAVCGLEGPGLVEAAHTGDDGGTALKSSDYSCIPLCAEHHTMGPDAHHGGRETFERIHGLDVKALVKRLNGLWFRYSQEVK
jgi:hypothetical protein